MDAFAAFSLACGIIQVVDFSTKVVKRCHELYRDGASAENKEIEEMAKHLTILHTNLDLSHHGGDEDLMDLGSKCSSTARQLIAELAKMKVIGPHKTRQALKKTVRGMFKGNAVDDIEKRLGEYRKLLDSRILIDLRFVNFQVLFLTHSKIRPLHHFWATRWSV